MSVLNKLAEAESQLPGLLEQPASTWNTLHVNYQPPRVERCWRELEGGFRLMLHRIHPCEEALYHPHPWPCAVRIVSGEYEMELGSAGGPNTLLVLTSGAAYAMPSAHDWHSVRPLNGPSLSIMVVGQPWESSQDRSFAQSSRFGKGIKHEPLTDECRDGLLAEFRRWVR